MYYEWAHKAVLAYYDSNQIDIHRSLLAAVREQISSATAGVGEGARNEVCVVAVRKVPPPDQYDRLPNRPLIDYY